MSATPSDIFKAETALKREQLNQAPNNDTPQASIKNSVTEAAVKTTLKEEN